MKSQKKIIYKTVLDGKLAVSCNLKSAYAGLNSERRVLLSSN
tara:strand:+ start:423 stop:548 length:126 start_codon:yes stop_codon:yes gene_type:complete